MARIPPATWAAGQFSAVERNEDHIVSVIVDDHQASPCQLRDVCESRPRSSHRCIGGPTGRGGGRRRGATRRRPTRLSRPPGPPRSPGGPRHLPPRPSTPPPAHPHPPASHMRPGYVTPPSRPGGRVDRSDVPIRCASTRPASHVGGLPWSNRSRGSGGGGCNRAESGLRTPSRMDLHRRDLAAPPLDLAHRAIPGYCRTARP